MTTSPEQIREKLAKIGKRINSHLSLEIKLFICVFIAFALIILPLNSPNEKSHFALAKAILNNHSFVINDYVHFVVIDLSQFQGNFYSPFSPGLSVLLVVPIAIGGLFGSMGGHLLESFGVGSYATPAEVIATQLFSALCTAVSVVFVYKLCVVLGASKYSALAVNAIYAFATPVLVFGKTQFPHTYSALFLVMAYYCLLKNPKLSMRRALLIGIFSGIAISIEYTNAVLIFPAIVYVLVNLRKEADVKIALRKISILIAPVLVVGFFLLDYNYVLFHNFFAFPEEYWIGYDGQAVNSLSQFSTPLLTGLQGLLISSSRGLLLFSPIVILALPGFYILAKKRKWEAITLASVFLCNLFLYSKWDLWNGGASFGPRFLVPSIPFLVIPIFAFIQLVFLSRNSFVKWGGVLLTVLLFAASVGIESIGALASSTAPFSNAPFFQFLGTDTGFSSILRGNLSDLLYLVFRADNAQPISGSIFGVIFWISFVAVLTMAFVVLLWKVGRSEIYRKLPLACDS